MHHEFSIPLVNKNPSCSSWGKKTKVPNDRSFHATRFLQGSVPACTNSLPAIRDGESQSVKGNWKFKAFAEVCPRVFKNRPCDSWGESYTVPRHLFGKAFSRGLSPRAY